MKKILALVVLICTLPVATQNVLSSQQIDLRKSSSHFRSLLAPDANETQITAFISDKEKIKALRYNGAIFFTDSLSTPRPDDLYEAPAGYSYSNGIPAVYWASEDMRNLLAMSFDFKGRTIAQWQFTLPFGKEETVLLSFSENNNFYLLSVPEERDKGALKVYIFNDGKYEVHPLDFTGFIFTDQSGATTTLRRLLKEYGLQKIDTRMATDPLTASSRIKLYSFGNDLLLTLDHRSDATLTFLINTRDFSITQKKFPQQQFKDSADANSFYHEGQLYQLKLNDSELALSAASYAGGTVVNSYDATKNDSISFRNSPLISQTGNGGIRELKDTKRFLRRAADGDVAISVYRTPNELLVTSGAVRRVASGGGIALGVVGVLAATQGVSADIGGLLGADEIQTVCFESLFDESFTHMPYQQGRLAADGIGQFTAQNRQLSLTSVVPFQDYFIMSYYNSVNKKFELRSFYDERLQ